MSNDTAFFDELRVLYVVEREIGRGGMATVYLAHEVRHRRQVALKVLRAERATELAPERFLREIETAARLQHPHILPVFDSGESAGRLWFTMPYVDGESLRERLSRTPPLSVADAVRIAREAAQALEYAHRQGVVHRDIKPENILLSRDGSTLVADFGIARSAKSGSDRITSAGAVMGTPSYMSPEQAGADAEVDGRSDIYSLGCVLYEMVAGHPPFTGATPHAVVARHLTEPPPPLRTAGRSVPPPLERAILKAMAKAPADRFGSAAEFASALERPGVVGPERARARPMTIALAVVALVAALASGSLLLRRRDAAVRAGAGGTVASGFDRKLTQLTTGAGVEEWPAWSPDGTRLAYVAEVDGFRQLFVRTLASGEERRVTRGTHDDIQPAWSPDGARLVFVRAVADSGKLAPSDLNGWYFEGGDIWSVDLATGREAPLVANAFGPAWSPDGARLAFDAAWAGPRRIWICDSAGRNPRQLSSDSSEAVIHAGPRWSPDGRRLVFRRIEKTDSDIMTAEVASDATTRVTHDVSNDLDPAWSPDGRWIYFASNRGGGINVWRIAVSADGQAAGSPRQLTTGAGDDVEPVPAPDGHRVAFAVRGVNADLWQLPVSPGTGAATGPPAPVVVSTREESRGAWSPDGRMIAFNSDRQGEMNIWLRDLGSGTDRRLTSGPGGDYQPSWAPDGRTLTFFSARAGHSDIWSVSVADGRLRRLTDDPGMDTNPFYSPDGLSIAFMSDRLGRTDVWVMNADGSGQRRLTSTGAGGHFLRWTKDGRGIVFRAETGTERRIMRVALEGGALTPYPDVASGGHMSWSPDQSIIMDVRGHRTIWVYPVDGSAPRRVFGFDDADVRIDYPVWSPDGRRVLFDRAAPHGGDLWLLDGIE
jgi:Tol biopolymer transport system component